MTRKKERDKSSKGYNSNRTDSSQQKKKEKKRDNLIHFKRDIGNLPTKPGEYYIPEIDIKDYYYSVKRLFKLIEDDIKDDIQNYGSYDDDFMKQIFLAQTHSTELNWQTFEKQRRFQQALSARLGDFHEELSGKISGYRTLPPNHWSGLDVIKEDKTEIYEWKNRANVSTDILTNVYNKFKKIIDGNKITHCILVHVNIPGGWKAPKALKSRRDGETIVDLTVEPYKSRVHIISGREAYGHMTGRPDFFDRLLRTMEYTFKDQSLEGSLQRVGRLMNEAPYG